jgi:uncharacterized protein (DUF1501 family)
MPFTRREFLQGGVAAFTMGVAAPSFLSDLAIAQGATRRNLVVLYLQGGNDALSTVVPYTDAFYYSRRPTLAIPAGTVLQIGSDKNGKPLGLHPRLGGLKTVFNQGQLAIIERTGYQNSSRSHFLGTDIWSTANPANSVEAGWLGRYLDSLPSPVDPLTGWCTVGAVPHSLVGNRVSVPAIASISSYALQSPNSGVEASYSRAGLAALSSIPTPNEPYLAFVNGTVQTALATLDRVASVGTYAGTVTYGSDGLSLALKTVAGAIVRDIGTKVFWVQTGGFDTHSAQGVNAANGSYAGLMNTLSTALTAFYNDLRNQGLLQDTLLITFSEFGRRITENGSQGTDHGAAAIMLAMGGTVNGGVYGTAPSLDPSPSNPTLENNGADVTYETDFRSVYARAIENWLGADSVALLGGDFRKASLTFV